MIRRVKKSALATLLALTSFSFGLEVTDIAGRTVTLDPDHKVERILLGEGRYIQALALLEGDKPFDRIIGWQGDFKKLDPQTYETYRAKFPEIDKVALIGNSTPESVSSEKVLSLLPDVAIFGISGHGPGRDSGLVRYLEDSEVPVIFVDFRSNPLENTVPSMRLIGQAIQREKEAEAFIDFYETELKRVTEITKAIPEEKKRSVFIELKAGTSDDCCGTAGNGNMGDFIDLAGGKNISKPLLPAALGKVNLEKVIVSDPDVYIATGSILPNKGLAGIPFGMQTEPEASRKGLEEVLERVGIADLTAVKEKRAYALWHNYYNSPYNVLAIQNIAKWLYPEEFEALDPADTLKRMHEEFLPVEAQGTFWIELEEKSESSN